MTNLIRAEALKLRTTRVFWLYVGFALLFVPVSVALAITGGPAAASLETSAGLRNVMSSASAGGLLVLLVGISMTAGEFRHNTATTTFLTDPHRRRVVAAKLVVGAVVGVGIALLASVLTLAIGLPWLAAKDVSVDLVGADVVMPLLGSLIGGALAAVVGVGLGALFSNQTLVVTLVIIWTALVESLLVGFLPEVGRWLPGGAAASLAGTATEEGGLLPFWGAAAVLVGYGLAVAAAGTRRIERREIA